MLRLRSLLSAFSSDNTSPPEPFGYKMGWIAVRSTDMKAVAASIPLRSQSPASWHDGLAAAYKSSASTHDDTVFIAPPINVWICIVGWWAMGTSEKDSVRWTTKTVSGLSARFSEAHGYATYRIIDYHHWIMAKQGQ